MQQITITIGRGQAGTDRLLGTERWEQFKRDIERTLVYAGFDVVVSNDGTGEWEVEGQRYSEQNHVWIGVIDERNTDLHWQDAWRRQVSRWAHEYEQDAIALGFGISELREAA